MMRIEVLNITAVPAVWPIRTGPDFKGVYNREKKNKSTFFKTPRRCLPGSCATQLG